MQQHSELFGFPNYVLYFMAIAERAPRFENLVFLGSASDCHVAFCDACCVLETARYTRKYKSMRSAMHMLHGKDARASTRVQMDGS